MKRTKNAVIAAAEKLGWKVSFRVQESPINPGSADKYVEFEGYSPAGENILWTEFYDKLDDIPDKLYERYTDFDPEEHAAGWYNSGNGEPSSLRELLDDAYAQGEMLAELIRFLREAAA